MFTLATPSALLALLGLLVPLAIHLWNRRPGREVAVGSLRWLAAGANRRLRNLRLEQVGLLLLRAAALAGLALAIAGPGWRQPLPAGRGQVLVSPALLGTGTLAAVRPTIDSLRRRGYGLRWLAMGFPAVSAASWRADSLGEKTAAGVADSAGYWSRVQQAGAAFTGQPLYVVTPAALRGFGGTHPALPAGLTWQLLPDTQPDTWLHRATATADSLHLLVGIATEKRLSFKQISVKKLQAGALLRLPGLPALRYATAPNRLQPQATALGRVARAVPVRAATLRAWVYAPAGAAPEAHYLGAALRAAALGLPGPLALTVAPALPDTATHPDWLFWLSDEPVPAAWRGQVRHGLHLWQQAARPSMADTATLVAPEISATPVAIWRRARLAPAAGIPLWTDGLGRAVLTQQPEGRGATYLVATRLRPDWSALPGSPALPALLLGVLAPPSTAASLAAHDLRRFDLAQLPLARNKVIGRPASAFRLLDLRPWLVLVVGLLFALERWLARRALSPSPAL